MKTLTSERGGLLYELIAARQDQGVLYFTLNLTNTTTTKIIRTSQLFDDHYWKLCDNFKNEYYRINDDAEQTLLPGESYQAIISFELPTIKLIQSLTLSLQGRDNGRSCKARFLIPVKWK